MEGFEYGKLLVCPSGVKGGALIKFELGTVLDAESRLGEVARVTPGSAPSLLAAFNQGYLDLGRMMARLKMEHGKAVRTANRRKSQVILDVAPKLLLEKGLINSRSPAGSQDLREAVLDQDDEYQAHMDRVDMIAAVHADLHNRQKSVEMAYTAVKRIIDRGAGNGLGDIRTGIVDIPTDVEVGMEMSHTQSGKARYGKY